MPALNTTMLTSMMRTLKSIIKKKTTDENRKEKKVIKKWNIMESENKN